MSSLNQFIKTDNVNTQQSTTQQIIDITIEKLPKLKSYQDWKGPRLKKTKIEKDQDLTEIFRKILN